MHRLQLVLLAIFREVISNNEFHAAKEKSQANTLKHIRDAHWVHISILFAAYWSLLDRFNPTTMVIQTIIVNGTPK